MKKKFLDPGCPVETHAVIYKKNSNIRITNPENMGQETIAKGSQARIHSKDAKAVYTVWVLDPVTYKPVIIEVPQTMMSSLFTMKEHKIFPHFA